MLRLRFSITTEELAKASFGVCFEAELELGGVTEGQDGEDEDSVIFE